jgi:hypothetical protein
MIHNYWLSITHHYTQPLVQHNTPWFTTTGSQSQWLWIIVCYAEPVVVNHVVLCWASGCKSLCVILSQWLWIMVNYFEPVVVNNVVLFWASGCESWWVMLSQWFWIMVCYSEPVVVNHGVLCWTSGCVYDSQHLSPHNTPWFTTTGSE